MSDLDDMNIGQVVDYCITYNNIMNPKDKDEEKPRRATQSDWDNL